MVFPRLFEGRAPEAPLRIWVPGCSTGEEAYSIAMSLVEFFDGRPAGHAVQIFATDIDDQALSRARQGIYPQTIELDLSPDRLKRFFSRHDKSYQVARPIRDMVVFAPHNLGKDPPFSRLDLVSCRNVLIYMQAGLQRRALRTFHYALNPDGFLLLGTSESVGDAADLFSLVDRKLKIYAKKNVASAGVFDFGTARQGLGAGARTAGPGQSHPGERRPPALSLQQLADRKILDKYGPPGVLVDENLDVLQFRGRTGAYLESDAGHAHVPDPQARPAGAHRSPARRAPARLQGEPAARDRARRPLGRARLGGDPPRRHAAHLRDRTAVRRGPVPGGGIPGRRRRSEAPARRRSRRPSPGSRPSSASS